VSRSEDSTPPPAPAASGPTPAAALTDPRAPEWLLPHPTIDTAAIEQEIHQSLRERRAAGALTEQLVDLLYRERLDYGRPDAADAGVRGYLDQLLAMPPLRADFRPVSVRRGVGRLIQAVKRLAVWAVRGLVQDVAEQQNAVNRTVAVVLDHLAAAVDQKVDRRADETVLGVDRLAFYRALRYPEPFPVDLVARLVPEGARVWDLGAGDGTVLAALSHARGLGVEWSPSLVRAAEQAGQTVLHADLVDFLAERAGETADVILLARVVDHLWPRTLVEVLQLARERLAPGTGRLLVASGPRAYVERDLFAVRFYPYAALVALLEAEGFAVRLWTPAGVRPAAGAEPEGWYVLEATPADG
jgi:predicted TPR repeat methyltransferase